MRSLLGLFSRKSMERPRINIGKRTPGRRWILFTTYGKKDMEKLIHSGEVLEKLGTILSSRDSGYAGTETRFEKIQIHAGKEQGRVVPHPELILIIGEMKEILREDIRREALTAAEKRMRSISVSGIFLAGAPSEQKSRPMRRLRPRLRIRWQMRHWGS